MKARRMFLPNALGPTVTYTAYHPPSKQQLATLLCNASCGSLIVADCFILLLTVTHIHLPQRDTSGNSQEQIFCMFLHFLEVLIRNITQHTQPIILFLFV
jgi:hypothetical protein